MHCDRRRKAPNGALKLFRDFDHNLAKRALREMLVGFSYLLEWVHLVDHGADLVFVEEQVHSVK